MDNEQQQISEKLLVGVKGLLSAFAGKDVVVRSGEATILPDPEAVTISGVIQTPAVWLEKKVNNIDQSKAHVEVNFEEMSILLVTDEESSLKNTIKGTLAYSPEFKTFAINSGKYIKNLQLSELIRMNRSYFSDKETAMKLVSICRNFKVKVDREMELSDDKKGNAADAMRQTVVQTNTPDAFDLFIPIFRGGPTVRFTVEIDIDPATLNMTLVSPMAKEYVVENRNDTMNSVIEKIKEIAPNIPIIEI